VDKPNKGNTIKIKLNGETKNFEEEPKQIDLERNIEPIPRVIEIDSNKLENDVFLETAAAQESVDESFDWIIPETSDQDIEEFTIAGNKKTKKPSLPKIASFSTNSIKKKKDRNIVTIITSAAFAILIGTTIGFVMLKLVITGPTEKAGTATVPTVAKETGNTTVNQTVEKASSAITMDQLTTYVIQGGVFSSKDGAKETSTEVTSKGVPAKLVEISGKQYLFLGVADSIETAKSLGIQYKADGVEDVFAKPLLLDEKQVSGLNDKEKSFLKNVPSIYETLSLATSTALLNNELSSESTKAITGLEAQLKTSGLKNEKVKTIKTELTTAADKLNTYQKSNSKKSLSQAQQHLLNFLSAYYSL
jgi:stage II sporulation protein B